MAEKQTNKDRMREIVDSIENGIKELFESDKYRQYLATMSRFHRYSVNNTMLIYMQRPDATHVAGFNKWRDQFGRNVLKGEKGIRIIAPTPYKKKIEEIKTDPETNAPVLDADGKAIIEEKEIRIPMFKVVSVFDVSQTAGKPLPQLAADLSGNVQQYEVFMEALRRASPVPMEIKSVARDTDGFFSAKAQSITIRAGMSEVQTVCAAVHEIAHAKLHDYEHMTELADDGETILVPGEKSRNTEEVEAESISYIPPRDVEQRFLNSPTDSMAIYQLRRDAPVELRFASLGSLAAPPDPANYEAIYTREVYPDDDTGRILENFYYIFNDERPGDFVGHSLSVSDIVALKQDGKVSYHYCDSMGFQELPAFQKPENYLKAAEMSMEDDYGMIDGIINNGPKQPTVADLEAQVKAGMSISLMDLAEAAHREKKKSVLEQLKSQPTQERPHKTAPKKSAEKEL